MILRPDAPRMVLSSLLPPLASWVTGRATSPPAYPSSSLASWTTLRYDEKFRATERTRPFIYYFQVPDIEPGEYVLSFRWDCEQTPQIWNGCSDITIV